MELMTHKGRILSRGRTAAGLFVAMRGDLEPGLYDIMEMDGVLTIKYVGKSALQEHHYNRSTALKCEDLFNERPHSMMTQDELDATGI